MMLYLVMLCVLAMAGTAQALYPHRNLMKDAVKAPPVVFALNTQKSTDADPCEQVSKAFEAMPKNNMSGKAIILDLRPSVGAVCTKSLPVATEQNIALLDYLRPYVEYQSTIELLKNPPEEYLLPGVDLIGGMKAMKTKLKDNGYQSQFDVMTDLQSLFVAANGNHFDYTPGLFSAFRQVREGFDFVSISTDGLELPQVFAAQDIFTTENTTYTPSPISTIDGKDVYEFLENDSLFTPRGLQDPDARLNNVFRSIPAIAAGVPGGGQISIFNIPDNYTIVHKNGTSRVMTTSLITLPTIDLGGIKSGQDFRRRFEITPQNKTTPSKPPNDQETQSPPPPAPTLPGYPLPLAKHSNNNVASYALNDTELCDTIVISFLSFVALNAADTFGADFDLNAFVREFGDVIDRTAKEAKEQGRDKLIIDMSANGGGSLDLADFAYTTFFPGAAFDNFDRYRMNGGLEFTGRFMDYNEPLKILVALEGLPLGPNNKSIDSSEAFLEAPPVKGQKMTAAFHGDPSARYFTDPDVFLRGYEPNQQISGARREAPGKPENIVILTDGQCASACSIFTGLMVRNFDIRTIALGGRPLNKPMQAIGGVKGTEVLDNAENKELLSGLVKEAQRSPDGRALLQSLGSSVPSIDDPPLLPFIDDRANGGSVNVRNAYSRGDVDGLPLHFKYESANCRLFYTRNMVVDVTESWRQATKIAFRNGTCVSGSTSNSDGRIGTKTLPFDPSVRSKAQGIPRPVWEVSK